MPINLVCYLFDLVAVCTVCSMCTLCRHCNGPSNVEEHLWPAAATEIYQSPKYAKAVAMIKRIINLIFLFIPRAAKIPWAEEGIIVSDVRGPLTPYAIILSRVHPERGRERERDEEEISLSPLGNAPFVHCARVLARRNCTACSRYRSLFPSHSLTSAWHPTVPL